MNLIYGLKNLWEDLLFYGAQFYMVSVEKVEFLLSHVQSAKRRKS